MGKYKWNRPDERLASGALDHSWRVFFMNFKKCQIVLWLPLVILGLSVPGSGFVQYQGPLKSSSQNKNSFSCEECNFQGL